jgi:arsenate reductase-like glutaredoxin family protein
MKHLKKFKIYEANFKVNNITSDDIIKSIKNNGKVWSSIINNLPNHDKSIPLSPLSIDDEDSLVTILNKDGKQYEVDLKNIERVEFN